MKICKIFFSIGIILILAIVPASKAFAFHSVDTTETFSKGAFTNFEAYYSYGYSPAGTAHGFEFLVGGGFLDNFSYFLAMDLIMEGSSVEIGCFGLGSIWTIVETEKVALDFIPFFSFDANTAKGDISYPGFDAFFCGADFELNLTMLKAFQPFIQAGAGGSYDDQTEESGWEVPLALGAVMPVKDNVEFLMQISCVVEKDADTWNKMERAVAAGFNIMAMENLEVITGLGWEFTARQFGVKVGLIYAL